VATADGDGAPWATPVWFAADDLDRVYWLSWPGSRHSQLIHHRPEVALTVFDTDAVPNEGTAFYATARARQCAEEGLESRTTVRHPEWGEGVVMSTEPDRVTVLFAEHGYKTLSLDAVRENGLLQPLEPAAS